MTEGIAVGTGHAPVWYGEGIEEAMGTLYLNTQYSLVKCEGEALVVEMPKEERGRARQKVRVPLIKVDQVAIFGDVTLTTAALHLLLQRRIAVHYLTMHGRSYGSLAPDPAKNVALRLGQHRAYADPAQRFALARRFVGGKLRNMRTVLLRYDRTHDVGVAGVSAEQIKYALADLERLAVPVTVAADDRMHGLGQLMGCEGNGTSAYFRAFATLLHDPWTFPGRIRRPPRDPVNALLSFGYTILTNQAASLIALVGLDPYIGFLHSPGFGKPALALDIIEEFRPLIVDPVVVTLLNTGVFRERDFVDDLGSIRLADEPRKLFLQKLEERLNTTIQHPYFGYKTTYRRCIELQVRLLGKALQGEIPQYVPFTVR